MKPPRTSEARRAYQKAYDAAHREERRAYLAAYREAHRDQLHAQATAYREARRGLVNEQRRATKRAYDATHSVQRRAYFKTYREAHSERHAVAVTLKRLGLSIWEVPSEYVAVHEAHIRAMRRLRERQRPSFTD